MAKAGDVIPKDDLTSEVLQDILDKLGIMDSKIAIGLVNETGKDWTAFRTYYFSGLSEVTLPEEAPTEMALLYDARKGGGIGNTYKGVVGVLGCTMADGNTLGVMFSIPFDRNLYINWWNAKVYIGSKPVDRDMYEDLYANATSKGDNQWHDQADIGFGYTARGVMASSGNCKFMIYIKRIEAPGLGDRSQSQRS